MDCIRRLSTLRMSFLAAFPSVLCETNSCPIGNIPQQLQFPNRLERNPSGIPVLIITIVTIEPNRILPNATYPAVQGSCNVITKTTHKQSTAVSNSSCNRQRAELQLFKKWVFLGAPYRISNQRSLLSDPGNRKTKILRCGFDKARCTKPGCRWRANHRSRHRRRYG